MSRIIDMNLGVATGSHFNELYFDMHGRMMKQFKMQKSRNGNTVEELSFKTQVKHPLKRCIGGNKRNINIFFLLAEALWIWAGRKDVAFLDTYNSQLKQYSDDGVTYHAPYGYRLRHLGSANTENPPLNDTKADQIATALQMLLKNPDDRRVVLQIWNGKLDLATVSKDIPCNDLVFLKIRSGVLHTTVANRSNDLNLGLTTNIFQFSFISEIMAHMLGIGLGQQTHNSDSLHIYVDTPVAKHLFNNPVQHGKLLYDYVQATPFDFNYLTGSDVTLKLKEVDTTINSVIAHLKMLYEKSDLPAGYGAMFEEELKTTSPKLYQIFNLLHIYVKYKKKDIDKVQAFKRCIALFKDDPCDYTALAANFFATRLKEPHETAALQTVQAEDKSLHFLGTL